MDCSKIATGLQAVVCGKPAMPGTGSRVVLLNYADVDRAGSEINQNVIAEIAMKNGAKGYEFESIDNSATGTSTFNKGTYMNTWQHDLALRIFAKTEEAKAFVNKLNGARIVALVENKEQGEAGEVKWEAYGWDAGLQLNEATGETAMTDLVVYSLTLGSGDTSKESSLPKSVFAESLEATETMINALVATAA